MAQQCLWRWMRSTLMKLNNTQRLFCLEAWASFGVAAFSSPVSMGQLAEERGSGPALRGCKRLLCRDIERRPRWARRDLHFWEVRANLYQAGGRELTFIERLLWPRRCARSVLRVYYLIHPPGQHIKVIEEGNKAESIAIFSRKAEADLAQELLFAFRFPG